jgi:hypothetical protein
LETNFMVAGARQHAPILSVASFRAWLPSRPDEEHWELIEGVPMMMTPPNRRHQRIAFNLVSLLDSAFKSHGLTFAVYRDIGVNIASAVPYVDRRTEDTWRSHVLRDGGETLSLPDFGLIRQVRDIYRDTPLG